jgi:uncharacterized protein YegP (UPF0339 family)
LAGAAAGGWVWQYLKRGRQPGGEAEPDTGRTSQDTQEGQPRRRSGKFVVEKDPGGKYRFSLIASNGQVIATSAAYERRQAALSGIEAVKKNAPDAEVDNPDGD